MWPGPFPGRRPGADRAPLQRLHCGPGGAPWMEAFPLERSTLERSTLEPPPFHGPAGGAPPGARASILEELPRSTGGRGASILEELRRSPMLEPPPGDARASTMARAPPSSPLLEELRPVDRGPVSHLQSVRPWGDSPRSPGKLRIRNIFCGALDSVSPIVYSVAMRGTIPLRHTPRGFKQ